MLDLGLENFRKPLLDWVRSLHIFFLQNSLYTFLVLKLHPWSFWLQTSQGPLEPEKAILAYIFWPL